MAIIKNPAKVAKAISDFAKYNNFGVSLQIMSKRPKYDWFAMRQEEMNLNFFKLRTSTSTATPEVLENPLVSDIFSFVQKADSKPSIDFYIDGRQENSIYPVY